MGASCSSDTDHTRDLEATPDQKERDGRRESEREAFQAFALSATNEMDIHPVANNSIQVVVSLTSTFQIDVSCDWIFFRMNCILSTGKSSPKEMANRYLFVV